MADEKVNVSPEESKTPEAPAPSGPGDPPAPEHTEGPAVPGGDQAAPFMRSLRSLPRHSVDMLLTDPPYGTTRNFWDVLLPLPELWEAVKWAVKPDGAILFFAQCPYDKVLGASNLSMLRYEWILKKSSIQPTRAWSFGTPVSLRQYWNTPNGTTSAR